MTEQPYDKDTLISYRLGQAQDALKDSLTLIQQGRSVQGIINRSYYAIFYSVLALLISIGKGTSKHGEAVTLFNEHFINTKVFSKEMGKLIHRAFELGSSSDYHEMLILDLEQAIEIYNSANQFVSSVEVELSRKQ